VKAACLKNRGWVRWKQRRLNEAEDDLRSAIALEHNSPHSHCLLAQVLEAKRKQQEALVAWKNTLEYSQYNVLEQDECINWAKQRLQAQEKQP
jgi:cytochrome c-type biogenesis protein CcmH/NrfG